jgi:hypothetical protein
VLIGQSVRVGKHQSRERRRHWRQPSKASSASTEQAWLAELNSELRALINTEWDPIGVADTQPDEYDYLTGLLLDRLSRGDDRASICEFMYHEASYLCGDPASADAFGARVYAWFHTKSPPSPQ